MKKDLRILFTAAIFFLLAVGLNPVWAAGGNESDPGGEPPTIEAPKAPALGSAIADGGGMNTPHTAWTVGSGPGNDVGFDDAIMSNMNKVNATIEGNHINVLGNATNSTDISQVSSMTGQISIMQNSAGNSVVGGGTSVLFVNNQGRENGAVIVEGYALKDITIENTISETNTYETGTTYDFSGDVWFKETAAPGMQSTFNDGNASAAGGGSYNEHTAWTVGSGTGNDVGFARSSLVGENSLKAMVSGNSVTYTGAGALGIVHSANLSGLGLVTGQLFIAQNSGDNSVVGGGTAVNFINNVTTYMSTPLAGL